MSVVKFPNKRKWDAENVFDCLEIVKEAMQKNGAPDSILFIPVTEDGVMFYFGGKEMSSAEVIGILELVKNDVALGGGEE